MLRKGRKQNHTKCSTKTMKDTERMEDKNKNKEQ